MYSLLFPIYLSKNIKYSFSVEILSPSSSSLDSGSFDESHNPTNILLILIAVAIMQKKIAPPSKTKSMYLNIHFGVCVKTNTKPAKKAKTSITPKIRINIPNADHKRSVKNNCVNDFFFSNLISTASPLFLLYHF